MRTSSRRSRLFCTVSTTVALLAVCSAGCAAEQPTDVASSEAAQTSSEWTKQPVGDAPSDSNEHVSIATDRQGKAHAAYRGRDGRVHLVDVASRYDEIVDSTTLWTSRPELAFDAAGQPHVVFGSNRGILHATRSGSSWSFEPVGVQGRIGAIAIDKSGVLHVATDRPETGGWTATHSTKRPGAAQFEHTPIPGKIEGEIGFGATSMTIDTRGTAYIVLDSHLSVEVAPRSFRSEPPHAYVAKRPAGGAFSVEVLPTSAQMGFVAVDANDAVHLVIGMRTRDGLTVQPVHMKRGPGDAEWSAPDPIHWDGFYGSLAVDAAGTLHLAITGNASSYLKYAKRPAGGTWSTELISEGRASRPSLALDGRGNAVIAYAHAGGYSVASRRSP